MHSAKKIEDIVMPHFSQSSRKQYAFVGLISITLVAIIYHSISYTRTIDHVSVLESARSTDTTDNETLLEYLSGVESAQDSQHCYGSIDERKLASNLPRLTAVVSRVIGPYLASVGRPTASALMLPSRTVPIFSCSDWQFSSPSGSRSYTRAQLLSIATEYSDTQEEDSAHLPVPDVAHFILPFANPQLRFHHMVCILSCVWTMKPRLLYLWQVRDRPPTGPHWRQLRNNLTSAGLWESRVVLAVRNAPRSVYGVRVSVPEHQSDLMRMEALLAFGGVYMDLDVVTLKSLKPLRRFSFVLGRQGSVGLCNGAILAAPGNQLLAMWHLSYQTFYDSWWALHSVTLPDGLCSKELGGFPHLCHIEHESMHRPSWIPEEIIFIYGQNRVWNWQANNYMVHLWYRFHRIDYNMSTIRVADSMLGDMFRKVLFGSEAMSPK